MFEKQNVASLTISWVSLRAVSHLDWVLQGPPLPPSLTTYPSFPGNLRGQTLQHGCEQCVSWAMRWGHCGFCCPVLAPGGTYSHPHPQEQPD